MDFKEKVANFVDRYHYPVDEDEYVNAKIVNNAKHQAVSLGILGSMPSGIVGGLAGTAVGHTGRGFGIGALVGGIGFGTQAYRSTNNRYKADIADPNAMYARRKKEFDNHILPDLQDREDEYIDAIEDNAHNYHMYDRAATMNAGIGAVHAFIVAAKDEDGRAYHAASALSSAHTAYESAQKAKERKADYERMKARTPEERITEEQSIRNAYRSMRPSRREDEYEHVTFDGLPSRLAKRAGMLTAATKGALTGSVAGATTASDGNRVSGALTGAIGGAALGRTVATMKPLGSMTNVTGKMNTIKPFKPALLGTGG